MNNKRKMEKKRVNIDRAKTRAEHMTWVQNI
jgi:hypothetical protein